MESKYLYSVFKRTYLLQIITVWTAIMFAVHLTGNQWLKDDGARNLFLWAVGLAGIILASYRRRMVITKEEKQEEEIHISNLLYHAVVETSPDSVSVTDLLGKFIFASKQTALLHGYDSPDELIGTSAFNLFPLNEIMGAARYMDMTRTGGMIKNVEFNLKKKDGSTFPAELSAALIKNHNGTPVAFMAIVRDITERKRVADELHEMNAQLRVQLNEIEKLQSILREQAIQDPLTGLYNRRYMEEALSREAARATREGYSLSIVMLDMDNLKYLNDSYGHAVGDEAIKVIGKSIKANIRTEDIACRYGGDEFLVILHNTSADTARQRVEDWLRNIKERTFVHNGQEFKTAFSAGIATFPHQGKGMESVIRSADHALYDAKTKGRNLVVIAAEDGKSTK